MVATGALGAGGLLLELPSELPSELTRCPPRQVHVQTQAGRVFTFQVERDVRASSLLAVLQDKLNLAPESAVLTYKGQVLEEDLSVVCVDGPILLNSRPMVRSMSTPALSPNSHSSLDEMRGFTHVPSIDSHSPDDAVAVPMRARSGGETHSPPGAGSDRSSLGLGIREHAAAQAPPFVVVASAVCAAAVRPLVRACVDGIRRGVSPRPEKEGHGGTYFFRDAAGAPVAIVKPTDEEPLAPNNPKGFVGRSLGDPGLKKSIRVGEAALREAAAFLLDHEGFAKVPRTALVKATHGVFHTNPELVYQSSPNVHLVASPSKHAARVVGLGSPHKHNGVAGASGMLDDVPTKLASFQEFVPHLHDASEHSTSQFAVRDVHRLGILDVRLYNTDRHSGNILVRRPADLSGHGGEAAVAAEMAFDSLSLSLRAEQRVELIPIDHGYCLPESLDAVYFEWLFWPQAAQPFAPAELQYIARLSVRDELTLLRRELPMLREESLRMLEASTEVLQRGAAAGLSLAEIGTILSRPLTVVDEEPSKFEVLCARAMGQARDRTAPVPRAPGGGVGEGAESELESEEEEEDCDDDDDGDSEGNDSKGEGGDWSQTDDDESSDPTHSAIGGGGWDSRAGAGPLRFAAGSVQRFRGGQGGLHGGEGLGSAVSGRLGSLVEEHKEDGDGCESLLQNSGSSRLEVVRTSGFVVRKGSLAERGRLHSSYRSLATLDLEMQFFEPDDRSSDSASSSPSASLTARTVAMQPPPPFAHNNLDANANATTAAAAGGGSVISALARVGSTNALARVGSLSAIPCIGSNGALPAGGLTASMKRGVSSGSLSVPFANAAAAEQQQQPAVAPAPPPPLEKVRMSWGDLSSTEGDRSETEEERNPATPIPPPTLPAASRRQLWGDNTDTESENETTPSTTTTTIASRRSTLANVGLASPPHLGELPKSPSQRRSRRTSINRAITVPHGRPGWDGAAAGLDDSSSGSSDDIGGGGGMPMATSLMGVAAMGMGQRHHSTASQQRRHSRSVRNSTTTMGGRIGVGGGGGDSGGGGGRGGSQAAISRLTGAHARAQRLGRAGGGGKALKTVCLGDMSEHCWHEFRVQLRLLLDSHMAAHRRAAAAVTPWRSKRPDGGMAFGTSCPRF